MNLNESCSQAIKREINEELNLNLKKYKHFLSISINSRHFKKYRMRKYYSVIINKKSIKLNEGQSIHFLTIGQIKKLNFVPWDLSALLYFDAYILKNRTVKPRNI